MHALYTPEITRSKGLKFKTFEYTNIILICRAEEDVFSRRTPQASLNAVNKLVDRLKRIPLTTQLRVKRRLSVLGALRRKKEEKEETHPGKPSPYSCPLLLYEIAAPMCCTTSRRSYLPPQFESI